MKRILLFFVCLVALGSRLEAQTGIGSWVNQQDKVVFVTSDFTTASGSLVNITGLSWTYPANTAVNRAFWCKVFVSQATAAAANAFGIQAVTISPTNLEVGLIQGTSATAIATGAVNITNTTATNIASFTPSAITTVWPGLIQGFIENPSNASSNTVNLMILTGNVSDSVTVKRGSYCVY